MRVHKISNVNKALDFIASKGVKLVSIGAEGKATSWLSDLSGSKLCLPLPFSHICISVPFVPPWPYHVYFSIETEQLLVFSLLQSLWENPSCCRTCHGSKPRAVTSTGQGSQRLQSSGLPGFLHTLEPWVLWLVSPCTVVQTIKGSTRWWTCKLHSRELCRIFVFLAKVAGVLQIHSSKPGRACRLVR